jgi:hypothetical protein
MAFPKRSSIVFWAIVRYPTPVLLECDQNEYHDPTVGNQSPSRNQSAAVAVSRPVAGGPWAWAFHRLILNSAISIEYLPIMAIRLPVNSVITLRISKGDLIVASLWVNSNANCALACVISSSFA